MPSPQAWSSLARDIKQCQLCVGKLPLGPRPIFAGSPTARIAIIGQAPGRLAHLAGVAFADASGNRLRDWLGLDKTTFYDAECVAITPMGFCYPGTAGGGDKLPDPICHMTWHRRQRALMPDLTLTLLVGGLAQKAYLADFSNVTDSVFAARSGKAAMVPLPHPSWHNNAWLKKHPWFEMEMLPRLRARVAQAIARSGC